MDKSWIKSRRNSLEYDEGVENFMNFAINNSENKQAINCPCVKCGNMNVYTHRVVKEHLYFNGFDETYTNWYLHGEMNTTNQWGEGVGDIFAGQHFNSEHDNTVEMVRQNCGDKKSFRDMLHDAQKPFYPGCEDYTKLGALVNLFNIKGRFGWSDKSFTELLKLLSDVLPEGNEVPSSMYEAKKSMSALGLEYQKIHACPNNCVLYRKEYENLETCPSCGVSRWKRKEGTEDTYREGIPAKVMWYFPIIPRFQRMFQSSETARNLIWHSNGRVRDGKLRHPADSPSWKLIDEKWPEFARDPRNLRLALSADGFNPHSSLSSTYSCWPVLLVIYNLPPWLCMKRKNVLLSILISGPQQPGNDIDVYLAPLVDDLKLLWDVGVEIFDSHKQQNFTLRAALMWTINDFPAYGNLSGCTVKGYNACPYCASDTPTCRLKHSRKNCYIGHRRWLPTDHPYRSQSKSFNNSVEYRPAPKALNGEEILEQVNSCENSWGKSSINMQPGDDGKGTKRKRVNKENNPNNDTERVCFKKKSIFFNLEYWQYLLVRHQLDVMHIEKNICESIYGTLLNMPGKTKDGLNSRLDLVDMKIRGQLAPQAKGNNQTFLPPACYNLTKKEKKLFCSALKRVKVPTGYSSSIRKLVAPTGYKLQGLKSHDCHVLMQQILPIILRAVLPKEAKRALIRLCGFFNSLCATVVDVASLDELQSELVVTLCLLEKCFPPSFFDIMVHLTVHLVDELRTCGPVYLRWMYPFERFMKILKSYVRNRYYPEGCIAESYIAEEAIELCSEFMLNFKTVGLPDGHVQKLEEESPKGQAKFDEPESKLLEGAHFYILENTEEILEFADEHMEELRVSFPGLNEVGIKKEHQRRFSVWLKEKVNNMIKNDEHVSVTVRWLSYGPSDMVRRYSAYNVNGYKFQTKKRDKSRLTQNSSVTCVGSTMQVSSSKDSNPITGDMCFYGVIDDIWEIDYNSFSVAVFKCNWVQNQGGVKVDEYGFTLVDLNRLGHKTDPFILASQAKQIWYMIDPENEKWSVVCHMPNRGTPTTCQSHDDLNTVIEQPPLMLQFPEPDDLVNEAVDENMPIYTRDGNDGIWLSN